MKLVDLLPLFSGGFLFCGFFLYAAVKADGPEPKPPNVNHVEIFKDVIKIIYHVALDKEIPRSIKMPPVPPIYINNVTSDGDGLYIGDTDVMFYYYKTSTSRIKMKNDHLHLLNNSKPTKILIHGWTEGSKTSWYKNLIEAYQKKGDYNIMGLDWVYFSLDTYMEAAYKCKEIGEKIAKFFVNVVQSFPHASPEKYHVIGHSMGAHIAGFVGKYFANFTGKKLGRITALDAAGPFFDLSPSGLVEGLNKHDALFVDAVHTDGGLFGHKGDLGTVDYYPNGGVGLQPGCSLSKMYKSFTEFLSAVLCSHAASHKLFLESINSNILLAKKCSSNQNLTEGRCNDQKNTIFGENVPTNTNGRFYFYTNAGPLFFPKYETLFTPPIKNGKTLRDEKTKVAKETIWNDIKSKFTPYALKQSDEQLPHNSGDTTHSSGTTKAVIASTQVAEHKTETQPHEQELKENTTVKVGQENKYLSDLKNLLQCSIAEREISNSSSQKVPSNDLLHATEHKILPSNNTQNQNETAQLTASLNESSLIKTTSKNPCKSITGFCAKSLGLEPVAGAENTDGHAAIANLATGNTTEQIIVLPAVPIILPTNDLQHNLTDIHSLDKNKKLGQSLSQNHPPATVVKSHEHAGLSKNAPDKNKKGLNGNEMTAKSLSGDLVLLAKTDVTAKNLTNVINTTLLINVTEEPSSVSNISIADISKTPNGRAALQNETLAQNQTLNSTDSVHENNATGNSFGVDNSSFIPNVTIANSTDSSPTINANGTAVSISNSNASSLNSNTSTIDSNSNLSKGDDALTESSSTVKYTDTACSELRGNQSTKEVSIITPSINNETIKIAHYSLEISANISAENGTAPESSADADKGNLTVSNLNTRKSNDDFNEKISNVSYTNPNETQPSLKLTNLDSNNTSTDLKSINAVDNQTSLSKTPNASNFPLNSTTIPENFAVIVNDFAMPSINHTKYLNSAGHVVGQVKSVTLSNSFATEGTQIVTRSTAMSSSDKHTNGSLLNRIKQITTKSKRNISSAAIVNESVNITAVNNTFVDNLNNKTLQQNETRAKYKKIINLFFL